jgi:large subunit ribosomal protein L24
MPIHQSNLAILNTKTNKADRVAIDLDASGKKQRVFKSDRQPVPSPASA